MYYFFQVKLEKVDPYYIFHEQSLVDITDESRLSMTKQEASAWQATLGKLSIIFCINNKYL